jgi:hypothetical protein
MRSGEDSMIETRCVSSRAQSSRATGISVMSVAMLIRRSPSTKALSHPFHPTRRHLSHLKQEDMYDRIPASSLDVRKHTPAWPKAQTATVRRESDPLCGCAGNPVQPHLHTTGGSVIPRVDRHCLEDHWTPGADPSRRTSAAPVAGLARTTRGYQLKPIPTPRSDLPCLFERGSGSNAVSAYGGLISLCDSLNREAVQRSA